VDEVLELVHDNEEDGSTTLGREKGGHPPKNLHTKDGTEITARSDDDRKRCEVTEHFCIIDCKADFGFKTCAATDADLYSLAVPRDLHESRCVLPRIQAGEAPTEGCYQRPCPCRLYNDYFKKATLRNAFSIVNRQCRQWCQTGIKPFGVIDRHLFTLLSAKQVKALQKIVIKPFILTGKLATVAWKRFRLFYESKFKVYGHGIWKKSKTVARMFGRSFSHNTPKFLGRLVKAAGLKASRLGSALRSASKETSKKIGRISRSVGRSVSHGVKRVGSSVSHGVKRVGSSVSRGAKSVGKKVRNAFRRF